MCATCANVVRMSKMIQVRNVPEDVHRRLKVRAASEGKTLSDYLLGEISEIARLPTLSEMRERLRGDEPVDLEPNEIVRSIHEGRAEHQAKLDRLATRQSREHE